MRFVLDFVEMAITDLKEKRELFAKEKKETVEFIRKDLVRKTNLSEMRNWRRMASDFLFRTVRKARGIRRKALGSIVLTAVLVFISVFFYSENYPESYTLALFGIYLTAVFVRRIDSRVPIAAALVLLIITPFYLIKNLEAYANFLATLAYYFLVIGVVKQFAEYLREKPPD